MIFHLGKQSVFNRSLCNSYLKYLFLTFSWPNLSPKQVEEIGIKIMVTLFNGKTDESLNTCRYKSMLSKVQKSKIFVKPQQLPPTETAVKYHSLRAYLQTQIWQRTERCVNPNDWGWTLQDNIYGPYMMDLPAAPETLLNIIPCNCKTPCNSMRCVCKTNGFECIVSCGYCLENNCEISIQYLIEKGRRWRLYLIWQWKLNLAWVVSTY